MANTQNLSSQDFITAIQNNDQTAIKACLEYIKTLSPENREKFLNETDQNGQAPLHVAVSEHNVEVTTALLQYYPNGNYPVTEVMTPTEYEESVMYPRYDFHGRPTPNGYYTKDGTQYGSAEHFYSNRDYYESDEETEDQAPTLEVCSEGANPLFLCSSNYNENMPETKRTLNAVMQNASEADYHQAINQAISRNDGHAIEVLLKVGKSKGFAPSRENIQNMDNYQPDINGADFDGTGHNSVESVLRSNEEYRNSMKRKFRSANRQRSDQLMKDLNSNDPAKAQRAARECVEFFGDEILLTVAKKNNPTALKYLIEAGADINVTDQNEKTPLIIATENNQTKNIEFLANHPDCNIDAQDVNKNTALHWAVKQKYYSHVKILITAGARSDIENSNNDTAMEIAEKNATPTDRSILNTLKNQRNSQSQTTSASRGITSIIGEYAQRINSERETDHVMIKKEIQNA